MSNNAHSIDSRVVGHRFTMVLGIKDNSCRIYSLSSRAYKFICHLRWHSGLSAKVTKTQTWLTVITVVSTLMTRVSKIGVSFRALFFRLGFSSLLIYS